MAPLPGIAGAAKNITCTAEQKGWTNDSGKTSLKPLFGNMHSSLGTMRWKPSTVSQSSSKQTGGVLLPAQMSPCGSDHSDEFGNLHGEKVDKELTLMPSTAKMLLWKVHSPRKAGVLGFVPDPAELYKS